MAKPRKASKAPFPYGNKLICYFVIRDGIPEQLREGKAIVAVHDGETVYATWPGKYQTDLFVIDEPDDLLEALE